MKFAIIGAGYIGKMHGLGGVIGGQENGLVLEPSFVVRREQTNIPYPYHKYLSLAECVEKDNPDFVDICTPNDNHLQQVEAAAEYRLPIYCEKPLAADKQTAKRMCEIVKENNLTTAMAFNYRSHPALHLAREALEAGEIGNIMRCDAFFLHDSALQGRPRAWRNNKESGGGAMMDLGVHLMDMIRYLFGEIRITSAHTHIQFAQNSDVDEHAEGTAETQTGVQVRFVASRLSPGSDEDNRLDIYGEGGRIRMRFCRPYELEVYDMKSRTLFYRSAPLQLLQTLHYPTARSGINMLQATHAATIASFAKSLQTGEKCRWISDFSDGYKAQCLVDDFYKMAK